METMENMAYLPAYKEIALALKATHEQLQLVTGSASIDHIIETCEMINKNKMLLWQLEMSGALDSAEYNSEGKC